MTVEATKSQIKMWFTSYYNIIWLIFGKKKQAHRCTAVCLPVYDVL